MPLTLLTDLSTDVLSIIFSFVAENGNDIEFLARTNRLLRSVSVPFIQKHRYADVSDADHCTIPIVLRDLILDPAVARHVKSMKSTNHICSSNSWNVVPRDTGKFKKVVASNIEVYRKAIEKFIPEQSQKLWIAQIEKGNDDPIKALLILLSAEMKILDWEAHCACQWTTRCADEKVHYFFKYLDETKLTPHLRPPINLESISIHMHNANDSHEVLDVSEIIPLLTLPNLTTLVLSDVQGPFAPDSIFPASRKSEVKRTSPLKVLQIKDSCLSAEGLSTILSGILALEMFECRISDNDQGYSSGHTDSLSDILKAIEAHTSHSLKILYLIGYDTYGIIGGGETLEDLPNLHNFIALTHLKLNTQIFTNSFLLSAPPDLVSSIITSPPPSFVTPFSQPFSSISQLSHPGISTLLPPSLSTLILEGRIYLPESAIKLANKIHELLRGKEMYLPKLENIVVRDSSGEFGWCDEAKALCRACQRVGVRVDFNR